MKRPRRKPDANAHDEVPLPILGVADIKMHLSDIFSGAKGMP